MIYLHLFISFFQVGLFGIGGGYATLPLIQHQVIAIHHWLSMKEFTDVITISQMTPGPIAVNAATFVGIRIGGIPGAIIATCGCILPSCIIVMIISFFYFKYRNMSVIKGILGGLRPAVVALIAVSGVSILIMTICNTSTLKIPFPVNADTIKACFIFIFSVLALRVWKADPIFVMLGTAAAGILVYFVIPACL